MTYATCRRCGAQLAEPKLGTNIECTSCHAVYSVKTRTQAFDGAPHCCYCGAELDDEALRAKTRIVLQGGKTLHRWVCSACRSPNGPPLRLASSAPSPTGQ